MKKLILGSVLVLSSVATAQAATETFTFDMIDDQYVSSSGRDNPDVGYSEISFSDSQGGKEITASFTAWSDNYEYGAVDAVNPTGDDFIQAAQLYKWGSSGWGVVNVDERSSDSPGHSFDNMGASTDYDFVLVEFSESVELSGINIGWDWGSTADVTVIALGDNEPSLYGTTWSNWTNYSGYDLFSYRIDDNGGYYPLETGKTSTYWLIGAYSQVFDEHCMNETEIGFKLTGIQAQANSSLANKPSQPVPEPASLAIFGLGLVGLMLRKQRKA